MVKVALLVRVEAKPGKVAEVEDFLRCSLRRVQEEPDTTAWFALRMGATTFGIFDAFANDLGLQAHMAGKVAAELLERADELLSELPQIERIEVLAAKLPVVAERDEL